MGILSNATRDAPTGPLRHWFAVSRLQESTRELGSKAGSRRSPRAISLLTLSLPHFANSQIMSTSAEKWLTAPDGHEFYTKTWTPASDVPTVAQVISHSTPNLALAARCDDADGSTMWLGGVCAWIRRAHQAIRARLQRFRGKGNRDLRLRSARIRRDGRQVEIARKHVMEARPRRRLLLHQSRRQRQDSSLPSRSLNGRSSLPRFRNEVAGLAWAGEVTRNHFGRSAYSTSPWGQGSCVTRQGWFVRRDADAEYADQDCCQSCREYHRI